VGERKFEIEPNGYEDDQNRTVPLDAFLQLSFWLFVMATLIAISMLIMNSTNTDPKAGANNSPSNVESQH
jgi:hypothetical protein